MFWLKNKIPLRFQIIYTVVFVIYFAFWGGFKKSFEVYFFILVIAIMASSIQYLYLYFAEKGLIKLGIANKRINYVLLFTILYILNICGMLVFTPVGWNGGKSYIYFYGFYGVSSIGFMLLLLTPFQKKLLKS
ncbi:MAG: hypothetical protein ACOYMA_15160 [Bacteroidia bacterium]